MNAATNKRPHATAALALVTPLALLAALRFLGGTGPASAPAASLAPPIAVPASTSAPTPKQSIAAAWLAAWTPPDQIESPMLHPRHEEQAAAPTPTSHAPAPQPTTPQFTVKTIMGSGDRVMASINGKVYRVGGEPAPGWKITAIDAATKRVEITGPARQTLSITPQSPQR